MARQFHLWRMFDQVPYLRFAVTLEASAETEDGYRVVDHDPVVGDGVFLHRISEAMAKPVFGSVGSVEPDGTIIEGTVWLHPGDDGYFPVAVRQVPGSRIRSAGRANS